MFWKSVWIYLKSQNKFWNLKIWFKSENKLFRLFYIYPEGIEAVLEAKIENLELMVGHLSKINRHSALYLLRNSFAMPKLTYFLRLSPCFLKPTILKRYDTIIKHALVKILNIQLPEEAWSQATLPVAKGGLGLGPATEVA